jgi:hypothetical protein
MHTFESSKIKSASPAATRLPTRTVPAAHAAITSVAMRSTGLVEPWTGSWPGRDFSRLPVRTAEGTQALSDPALEKLRQPDGGAADAGPAVDAGTAADAGAPDAATAADAGAGSAAPTFPTYTQITGNSTVSTAMSAAWTATKSATTRTSRREQGFWIKYDTSASSYTCAPAFTGDAVGPGETGAADPGTKPADSGTVYTVGLFHTHTPMTYRTGGTRGVGPSGADNSFHTSNNVAGVVYDYVESPAGSGTIPSGHPLASAAQLYSSGPTQRT